MSDTLSDVQLAIEAACAGAQVLRSLYGTVLDRHPKTATDFATAADVESERSIFEVIRAHRPHDGFVGEELGDLTEVDSGRAWLIDPLCGTLNFAATTQLFSVNVALVDSGTTTAAVVAHPPTGELYWATETQFGIVGRDCPPRTSTRIIDINADGPLDRPFVGAQLAADPEFRAQFSPRIESTTLALAWVATGQRLAYVTDGRVHGSVHFTAGIALCQAAGCVITDFDGAPVHTGPGLVAARDPTTHTTLLNLIARHRIP